MSGAMRRLPAALFLVLIALKYAANLVAMPYLADRYPNGDASSYAGCAAHLWRNGAYPTAADTGPDYRPPGYCTLLAPLAAFGDGYLAVNVSTRILHAALDFAVVGALFLLALRLTPSPGLRCAMAALLALQPWTSRTLTTITPDTATMAAVFLGALVLVAGVRAAGRRGAALVGAGALLVHFGAVLRPEMLAFAPLVSGCFLLLAPGEPGRRARNLGIAAVTLALCLAANAAFRRHYDGEWRLLGRFDHRKSGLVAWTETWRGHPDMKNSIVWNWDTGEVRGIELEDLPDDAFDTPEERRVVRGLYEKVRRGEALSEADQAAFGRLAAERIDRRPLRYFLWTRLHNAPRYWVELDRPVAITGKLFWGVRNVFGRPLALAAYLGLKVLVLALCLVEIPFLWRRLRRGRRDALDALVAAGLLLAVARTLFFAFYLSHVETRYVMVAWPFVLLAACMGLVDLAGRLSPAAQSS